MTSRQITMVAPGIWLIRVGTPEAFTPVRYRSAPPLTAALADLEKCEKLPLALEGISVLRTPRGVVVELPMEMTEQIFGMGMNLNVVDNSGSRKTMRVSDNPNDTGDTHAPVPFYVSTRGYGVLVDTARYVSFYAGNLAPVSDDAAAAPAQSGLPATTTEQLYSNRGVVSRRMTIDVPVAAGVDLYIFGGPSAMQAVQRYNLFSGGGAVPPLWGLGVWYRGHSKFNAQNALKLAAELRDSHMPIDVFGLEPGWQSQSYSSSFVWSPDRFPDPEGFLKKMDSMGYKVNLWEHAFVHPTSPIHDKLKPLSGDYRVWKGLVPDFSLAETRKIFGGLHDALIAQGISGFKLDENDNQPVSARPWSFPEFSRFPSGMDGEQMHSLFGVLYQQTLYDRYRARNVRTYNSVRASYAMASPLPFVLYSDHYLHKDFVRAILTSGFVGVLWSPELRHAQSIEDLYRRIQTIVMSPQALVNGWYIMHPPWWQIDRVKNAANEPMENYKEVEAVCRELFQLRMSLIPYLYSAFSQYRETGKPPFRALVLEYPEDPLTFRIEDEYMMGDSLLIAPLFAGDDGKRKVYLPKGAWYDFWTGKRYEGQQSYTIEMGPTRIPVFAKAGSLVPLAKPVESVRPETQFELNVKVFGDGSQPFRLYEDDGITFDFEKGKQNVIELQWTAGGGQVRKIKGAYTGASRYRVAGWDRVAAQ
ncbi:MAG: TIM-barrel domain-containing protein [Candidatus Solibacter sp.]